MLGEDHRIPDYSMMLALDFVVMIITYDKHMINYFHPISISLKPFLSFMLLDFYSLENNFIIFTYFIYLLCVRMCTVMYGAQMEVRRQLAGVCSLRAPCGSWGSRSDPRLGSKLLYPLNHFIRPLNRDGSRFLLLV